MHRIDHKLLSDLIGAIHECAAEPARWPQVIERICREVGERGGAVLRLLAPHIRRAMALSKQMDNQASTAATLALCVDSLDAGVVLAAADARILYANLAARRMFESGGPMASHQGKLAAQSSRATRELRAAVAEVQANGVSALLGQGEGEQPAIAQVLPLVQGGAGDHLAPQAMAAVFVASSPRSPNLDAVAGAFHLTGAETRLLAQLAAGATPRQAAAELEVAESTARTHIKRIFRKTGVSRRRHLMALLNRLAPPARHLNG
jgi:DNA-binding CsgD family transcriptional regulator